MQVSEANLIDSGTSEHWVDDEGPQPKKAKVSCPGQALLLAICNHIPSVSLSRTAALLGLHEQQGPLEDQQHWLPMYILQRDYLKTVTLACLW